MGTLRTSHLPNLLLLGAQKSGTSTLHEMLRTHPHVEMSTPKELEVFAWADWQDRLERYATQYTAAATIRGEGTPLYLHDPDGPAKLLSLGADDLRLVCILRHPTDRAYSHYWHAVRSGNERLGFEEALASEERRIAAGMEGWRRYSYVTRGYYQHYLRPYEAAFGDRLLVLGLPQLLADPRATMRRTYEFLGLDPGPAETAELLRANPARRPRSVELAVRTQQIRRVPILRQAARALHRLNVVERAYPPMEPATKAGLDAGYQEVVDWARTAHGIEFRERAHTAAPDTPLRVAGPHHLWYDTPAGSSDRNA